MGQASKGDQDLKTQSDSHNNVVHDIDNTVCNDIIKLSIVNPTNTYHIVGDIPNQGSVKFMIDTGAAISLIREDLWAKITGSNAGLSLWTGCQLVGAEGSKINMKGVAMMVFSIGGQNIEGDFIVTKRLSSEATYFRSRLFRTKLMQSNTLCTYMV